MAAWADGSASTANTTSEAASIIVDALTPSVSIPVRGLAEPELIAAPDTGRVDDRTCGAIRAQVSRRSLALPEIAPDSGSGRHPGGLSMWDRHW